MKLYALIITLLFACSSQAYAESWNITKFKNAEGEEVSFEDYKGKTLLVKFWASWCPHCKNQMPAFSLLHKKYENSPNIKFLPISIDYKGKKEVERFYAQYHISNLPIYTDDKSELFRAFGLRGVPSILIISPEGAIIEEYGSVRNINFQLLEEIGGV
jgi:thiol-disulfide isomerase/thioredoxin